MASWHEGSDNESLHSEIDYENNPQEFDNFCTGNMNPVLINDIGLLKASYGDDVVHFRTLNMLSEMDLEITIPTTCLEKTVAEAWNIVHGKPVIVQLSVNEEFYLNMETVNKVDVYQRGSPSKMGALLQLKSIVQEFCGMQFKRLTNDIVKKSLNESFSLPEGDVAPENCKEIPNLDRGFLVQLYVYVQQRLLTLSNFCPICDNPHHSSLCIMLKPTICCNPLCVFSYQTLGVMANVGQSIMTETNVINLLICLTKAAAKSRRRDLILTPFPTIVHPTRPGELILYGDKKDWKLLETILDVLPNMEQMTKQSEAELETMLNHINEVCSPLIRWIISSNRAHIVKLPEENQLPFMGTKHQFMMRCSPPLQEMQFQTLRRDHGSTFAFHGSPIENWHSIIREGLIVASGTKMMMNGSVHGNGIYLSPSLAMSLAYSNRYALASKGKYDHKSHDSSVHFLSGDPCSMICITLCEVITASNLKKHKDIWTCDESQYVCTRFFFVYDQLNSASKIAAGVDTTSSTITNQIKQVMASMGI